MHQPMMGEAEVEVGPRLVNRPRWRRIVMNKILLRVIHYQQPHRRRRRWAKVSRNRKLQQCNSMRTQHPPHPPQLPVSKMHPPVLQKKRHQQCHPHLSSLLAHRAVVAVSVDNIAVGRDIPHLRQLVTMSNNNRINLRWNQVSLELYPSSHHHPLLPLMA